MRRLLLLLSLLLCSLPAAALGVLWAMQGSLIFPGPTLSEADVRHRAGIAGATLFPLPTSDGESLLGWQEDYGDRGAVIYFHGNAGICDVGDATRQVYRELGLTLFCAAYRGYPGSTGSPSETGLGEDARAIWRHARAAGFPDQRIVLHGRSLGGGVAVGLASEVDAAGVILESTFRSVRRVAAASYPSLAVDLLLRHPFDSDQRIERLGAPLLILHGDRDRTIPVEHGRWLAAHAPRATYVEARGHDHNSGLLWRDARAAAAHRSALATWLARPVDKPEE
jgi:fermentation-respiration switch protein FrsA (DUF1100 family)